MGFDCFQSADVRAKTLASGRRIGCQVAIVITEPINTSKLAPFVGQPGVHSYFSDYVTVDHFVTFAKGDYATALGVRPGGTLWPPIRPAAASRMRGPWF